MDIAKLRFGPRRTFGQVHTMSRGLPRILGFEEGMTENVIIEHQEPTMADPEIVDTTTDIAVEIIDPDDLKPNHNYLIHVGVVGSKDGTQWCWLTATYLCTKGYFHQFRLESTIIELDVDEARNYCKIGKTADERSRDQGPGVQS